MTHSHKLSTTAGILYFAFFVFGCGQSTTSTIPNVPTSRFTNAQAGLTGQPLKNYVDFSFDYPTSWQQSPNRGGPANYVEVQRKQGDELHESVSIGNLVVTGKPPSNDAAYRKLAAGLNKDFSRQLPGYKKISEGYTDIAGHQAYQVRFEAQLNNKKTGKMTLWGRMALLLKPGATKGVILFMMATDRAPEISSIDDVGVRGEMPVVLNSFRF